MRHLPALLACCLAAASAMAQTTLNPLPPRNLALTWVSDENQEVTVPVDKRPIRVTLPPTIFYDATVWQCGNRISHRVVSVRGSPVIELTATATGKCSVTFHTSRRTYGLDLTVMEYTANTPVAPVASITWTS